MYVNKIVSITILLFFLFCVFFKIRFSKKGEFFENYMSVETTRAIKGICAVLILLSHLCTYLADYFTSLFLFKFIGAMAVGGFFFVSGYGLQYGIMNKENYLKGFLKKRILGIAVPYYIINIFYIVTNNMPYPDIIKSLFGFYMWYIMAITIFYIGFYLCNKLFPRKYAPLAMTVFILLYIAVMLKLDFGYWWFNSCLTFAAGMWICVFYKQFTEYFHKKWWLKLTVLLVLWVLAYSYYRVHINDRTLICLVVTLAGTTLFSLLLAVAVMKIQLKSPLLRICGDLSLELYLTHALWIAWLRNGTLYNMTGTFFDNNLTYLIGIIVGTFIMSVAVYKVSGFITGNRRKLLENRRKM